MLLGHQSGWTGGFLVEVSYSLAKAKAAGKDRLVGTVSFRSDSILDPVKIALCENSFRDKLLYVAVRTIGNDAIGLS